MSTAQVSPPRPCDGTVSKSRQNGPSGRRRPAKTPLRCRVVKTLIIAEKPSVARDIVDALRGGFVKEEAYWESDENIVTFAVGHLVELVDPEEYDEKLKKWRMADLPIIPEEFKLRARDAKAKKQLRTIHKLLARKDGD